MAAIQLNFALRTSSNCKTVHLQGSWDNYAGQIPLSKDSSKPGAWRGTFRFQGGTLSQGSRYWYYYIIDGYHVSHDPAREYTTEPTTGRKLNVLDIPPAARPPPATGPDPRRAPPSKTRPMSTYSNSHSTLPSSRHARHTSMEVPHGRALSPSKIASPRPVRPTQTQYIAAADYDRLNTQFAHTTLSDSDSDIDSDISSDVPSLTSRSSSNSSRTSASSRSNSSSPGSPGSLSSTSSCCTCERYGITRSGNRIKLDCGGSRCGYSDGGSSCGSEGESEGEYERARAAGRRAGRRAGIIARR